MKTIKAFNPFLEQSSKLQELLNTASKQQNPALWLFQNNARTPLFMLEALTRLHDKTFDEKLFTKWRKRFKTLEDIFGEIDYYIWLQKEFSDNKKIDKSILANYQKKADKLIATCNSRLQQKQWFNGKLFSFTVKLSEYDLEFNQEYIDALKETIANEIKDIVIFLEKTDFTFTKLEDELHNMRRKLRWLSIYGQALNGLIQLKKTSTKKKYQQHYFTKDILNSPFNKLPVRPKNVAILEYDTDSFFALSWIINAYGALKDEGLKLEALQLSYLKTEDITDYQAKQKAARNLNVVTNREEEILKKASDIIRTFVLKDKVLNSLLIK